MRKNDPTLTGIENNRPVDPTRDGQFLRELKIGLLLALREQGLLTDLQLRIALEQLGGPR